MCANLERKMEELSGLGDPFQTNKAVSVFEYDRKGARRETKHAILSVLFDDSIGAIGAKVNAVSPGACWWIRRPATPAEVRQMVGSTGSMDKVLRSLVPEANEKARKRVLSVGGLVHSCPYLTGVYNAAVQCSLRILPRTPARRRISRTTLWHMTSQTEIHFISAEELGKGTVSRAGGFDSPRDEVSSLVKAHPGSVPEIAKAMSTTLSVTELGAKVSQQIDVQTLFSAAKLSPKCFAIARSNPSGESAVRVLEEAVRDGLASLASIRDLVGAPHLEPCATIPIGPDGGTFTVSEPDDFTFECAARDPASIASSWKNAKLACLECLALAVPKTDPEVRYVSMVCTPSMRGRVDPLKLVRTIQKSYSAYLDVALAADGAVECVYRRSPGPPRSPACVEHVLAKHARGQRALNESLAIIENTHAVTRDRARDMAEGFDLKLFRTHPPATVRVSHTNGVRLHLAGVVVGDIHRAMIVTCLAIVESLSQGATLVTLPDAAPLAKPKNALDIIQAAELEGLADATDPERAAGDNQTPSGIGNLLVADPDLFGYKHESKRNTYARSCGPHRQPLAVDDAEMDRMGADAPASVRAGPKRLNYICPEVWCEGSRTAMSRKQAEAAGWRCPDGDTAVDMMAASWWRNAPTRYIGFLKTTAHPDGFAMPCCFKTFGKMQRERRQQLGEAAEDSSQADGGLDRPGRYVMSSKTVPLPVDRRGDVELGARVSKAGVVRVGVNQRHHTFLTSISVIERVPLASMIKRLLRAITPTIVAAAASGSVMSYIMSRAPLDLRGDGAKQWFVKYAHSSAGEHRLRQRGMQTLVRSTKFSMLNPDIAREALVAHAFELAVKIVDAGENANARVIQLLVLSALGKRYPEVSTSGGDTYVSCIRWDERVHTGAVAGLLFRDGPYLEPLFDVPKDMLQEVSAQLSRACGSLQKSRNFAILEFLSHNKHIVTSQVCDESHVVMGVLIEGNLLVPFPEPHFVNHHLPLEYHSEIACAHARWTSAEVRKLFGRLAEQCSERAFASASFRTHSVRVGDAIVPLRGGELCLSSAKVLSRVLATQKTSVYADTKGTRDLEERSRVVRGLADHIIANDHHSYIALTSPLSPLTSSQKQALFEAITVSYGKGSGLKYTDVAHQRGDDAFARPGELFMSDEDLVDGSAEFVIDLVSSGSDGTFQSVRAAADFTIVDHQGLDTAVAVPSTVVCAEPLQGMTSSAGSLQAISYVVGLAGGVYGAAEHGRSVAQKALLHWRMTGELDSTWPEAARPLLQRAATPQNKDVAWGKLVAIAQSLEPTNADMAVAFANVPVQLEIHRAGIVESNARSTAPWRVCAWRTRSEDIAFATAKGMPLLPR